SPAISFLWKLDSNGEFVWARTYGSAGLGQGNALAIGTDGSVYAVSNTSNLFCKFDGSGNLIWSKSTGGQPYGMAIDQSGNAYITGVFGPSADFGPGPGTLTLTAAGEGDIFFSKFDASGNFLWAEGIGGIRNDNGTDVRVDPAGNVYVAGSFSGQVDFD